MVSNQLKLHLLVNLPDCEQFLDDNTFSINAFLVLTMW